MERIVSKSLEKDRNLRYQHAADMRADLQRLKRDTETGRAVAAVSSGSVPGAQESAAPPSSASVATPPGRRRLFGRRKSWRSASSSVTGGGSCRRAAAKVVEDCSAGGCVCWLQSLPDFSSTRAAHQALTEKDSILLADFVNTTGDSVFDGTLKQALAVQLEQSPYLNVSAPIADSGSVTFHGPVSRRARDQRCGARDLPAGRREGHADRLDLGTGQPLRH